MFDNYCRNSGSGREDHRNDHGGHRHHGCHGEHGRQGVSGSGDIVGDPHFTGAKDQHYDVQGEAGEVYSLLSDRGIEVNGKFQAYGSDGATTVGEMGVTLNGDRIDIKPGGKLEINGREICGDGCYLHGAVEIQGDTITINAPHYKLTVTDGGGYLNTHIDASNAGRRERPGGLWGQSLTRETVDTNFNHFDVAHDDIFGSVDGHRSRWG